MASKSRSIDRRVIKGAIIALLAAISGAVGSNFLYDWIKPWLMGGMAAGTTCPADTVRLASLCLGPTYYLISGLVLTLLGGGVAFRAYQTLALKGQLVAQTTREKIPTVDVLVLPVSQPGRDQQSAYYVDFTMPGGEIEKARGWKQLRAVHDLAKGIDPLPKAAVFGKEGMTAEDCRTLSVFCEPKLWITADDAEHFFERFSWQTGFLTLNGLLSTKGGRRLAAIHLVPSRDDAGNGTHQLAREIYGPLLKALLAPPHSTEGATKDGRAPVLILDYGIDEALQTKPNEMALQILVHKGVDYQDFREVQEALRDIVRRERKRFGDQVRIDLDVTGGTSSFAVVAAIEATEPGAYYSHIAQKRDPELVVYEVVSHALEPAG